MIKLFAILTVLAALPVSALAEQVHISKNSAIHCAKDTADKAFEIATTETSKGNADKAKSAL